MCCYHLAASSLIAAISKRCWNPHRRPAVTGSLWAAAARILAMVQRLVADKSANVAVIFVPNLVDVMVVCSAICSPPRTLMIYSPGYGFSSICCRQSEGCEWCVPRPRCPHQIRAHWAPRRRPSGVPTPDSVRSRSVHRTAGEAGQETRHRALLAEPGTRLTR